MTKTGEILTRIQKLQNDQLRMIYKRWVGNGEMAGKAPREL